MKIIQDIISDGIMVMVAGIFVAYVGACFVSMGISVRTLIRNRRNK